MTNWNFITQVDEREEQKKVKQMLLKLNIVQ